MADVFFGDNFEGDEEEEEKVSALDEEPEEEVIDPFLFVRSFVDSDDVMKRHRVAQTVSEAVRWLENESDAESIYEIVRHLSTDAELQIRLELVEELPDIIATCIEEGQDRETVLGSLMPVLSCSLYDFGDLVRKAAHSSLAALIEHGLINSGDVEKSIVPVLKEMATAESCVNQLEAARVIMRTAPHMNEEVIIRSFLPLIKSFAKCKFFEVRKTCATELGNVCLAFDRVISEAQFLPIFIDLCKDDNWAVRKGCSEAFYDVALASSLDSRFFQLAPLFIGFLSDASKWVQKATFQSLGAFISTFYCPCEEAASHSSLASFGGEDNDLSAVSSHSQIDGTAVGNGENKTNGEVEGFNSFLYWKVPLPTIKEPEQMPDDVKSSTPIKETETEEENRFLTVFPEDTDGNDDDGEINENQTDGAFYSTGKSSSLIEFDSSEEITSIQWNLGHLSTSTITNEDEEPDLVPSSLPPDNVPDRLIEFFISMVDPIRVQTLDLELPLHCAFSFPAVVLTLGPERWYRIRKVYRTLVSNLQWKVRRTLAYSIHELAKILSKEAIDIDLLPAFDSFLKDVDEVRIGALSHFSDFIQLLSETLQKRYLEQLFLFQRTDNQNNWRFRLTLAEQLSQLCSVCDANDTNSHICPISLSLAIDCVYEVRMMAVQAIGSALGKLKKGDDGILAKVFIDRIVSQFAGSKKWVNRQTFVSLCQHVLTEKFVSPQQFSKNLLPKLLALANDNIPNVRLTVSKSLADVMMAFDQGDSDSESVYKVLRNLLRDKDSDVKDFARKARNTIGYISQEVEDEASSEETDEEFVDASSDVELPAYNAIPVTVENSPDKDIKSEDAIAKFAPEEYDAYRTEEF
eukprot:m.39663 g.39663  ORF g.39663 m.39663 type:complete len:859 (+) comp32783_c0_seq7:64-2640(+)